MVKWMNGEFRRADVDIFFSTKKEIREGNGRNVNVWLQGRSLPARGRVGLGVHRCLCIIDAGNVFISTVKFPALCVASTQNLPFRMF